MVKRKFIKDLESRTWNSFGELAQFLRQHDGLGFLGLARQMGYPSRSFAAYIQQIEQGKKEPSAVLTARYARHYRLPQKLVLNAYSRGLSSRMKRQLEQTTNYLQEEIKRKTQAAKNAMSSSTNIQ